jgi:6-phosphogluconolactonase/glucosamine-6-phosphate isomerase/deaminase
MLAAKTVIAVVPEKRKAAIVRQTLQREEVSEAVPSTILRTMTHVRLYLDGASASEIMKL